MKANAPKARTQCGGAVLLEVVLALVLFVAAATVITSGLSASVHEVEALRLNLHANNLATSILAEMQMGIRAVEATGPNVCDPPFEKWTWQTTVGPIAMGTGDVNTLQKVEIVVKHQTESTVCRLSQFVPVGSNSKSTFAQNTR